MEIRLTKFEPTQEESVETKINGKWLPIYTESYIESKLIKRWRLYNSKGLKVHTSSNLGEETIWEYDSKDRLVHVKPIDRDSTSRLTVEFWDTYDKKGNPTGYKLKKWGRKHLWD